MYPLLPVLSVETEGIESMKLSTKIRLKNMKVHNQIILIMAALFYCKGMLVKPSTEKTILESSRVDLKEQE